MFNTTSQLPFNISPLMWWIIVLVIIWSCVWKAVALWKSAQNEDKAWFIVLFLLNTLGILDIFYIYVFAKREKTKAKSKNVSISN